MLLLPSNCQSRLCWHSQHAAGAFTASVIFTKWEITLACPSRPRRLNNAIPKFPLEKCCEVKTSYCVRGMIKKTKGWGGGGWCVGGKGDVLLPQYSLIMMMWFAGMAAVALVTNTSSPEPRNGALLNFMKGLAVQFMSLPAEDMSVQRQRKHCSTISDEITQNKKFYPRQYFSLALFINANTLWTNRKTCHGAN